MSKPWLIHIGMPKCGSTTLQHMIAETNDIFYELEGFSLNNISQEIVANAMKKHLDPYYDFIGGEIAKDEILNRYSSAADRAGRSLNAISCENFVNLTEDEILSFQSILSSLDIFPRILMVVRPSFEYLISSWKQAVSYGMLMPLEMYVESMDIDFQRIYQKWAREFLAVDLLELRKDKDFKAVAHEYFLHQHGISLNTNISPSQENKSIFRLLTCNTFIDLAKSHDTIFETTSIDLSWDPQVNCLPPFNLRSQQERVFILNKLESDIANNHSILEINNKENEILENIRQSLASKAIPPSIPQNLFWRKQLS